MKRLKLACGIALVSLVAISMAGADPLAPAVSGQKQDKDGKEKLVFVTGSRIPKRVTVKAIGTNTTSPVRVYTREELDRMGRFTTEGLLAQDPSVTIIGNGGH
jgi:outer membrane cobalamin receptor